MAVGCSPAADGGGTVIPSSGYDPLSPLREYRVYYATNQEPTISSVFIPVGVPGPTSLIFTNVTAGDTLYVKMEVWDEAVNRGPLSPGGNFITVPPPLALTQACASASQSTDAIGRHAPSGQPDVGFDG